MADFVGVDAADFKRVMGANARLTAENAALQVENERLSRGIDWAKADGALRNENAALRETLERIDKLAITRGDHALWVAVKQIRAECAKHKENA